MRHRPLHTFVPAVVGFALFAAATPVNHVALNASSGGPSLASLASTANLAAARKSMGSFEWGGNTYSWSVELTIGEPEEGLEPTSESEYSASHGPAVTDGAPRVVTVPMTCFAAVWDDDGYYNNFTIASHLKDPGGNEISPTPAPAYVTNHSYLGSTKSWSLSDPSEGTYTCKPDLYVYGYYLGSPTYQQTLSYSVPSGESTTGTGWSGDYNWNTLYKYTGNLTTTSGVGFGGRVVSEGDGGSASDSCFQDNDPYYRVDSVTGAWNSFAHDWTVAGGNTYGDDLIGLFESTVQWLRDHGRTHGDNGCSCQLNQVMSINRPGTSGATYKTNIIGFSVTDQLVKSIRDGQLRIKAY